MGLSFLVPAFLAGLAALALPVWIHLRNRRRSDRVEFPSLMFLRQVPTRSVQRKELRYRALFALRCLAFALLAVAFARPFLASPDLGAAGSAVARERVLLVDRSWSMEYGGRWDRAREAVAGALDEWRSGDRVSLVLFDQEAEVVVDRAVEPGAVAGALAGVEPGDAGTRFAAGLRVAQRILAESDLPGREILLVSDYQQVGWESPEALDMPEGTRLIPVDLSEAATNLAVADVSLRRRAGGEEEGGSLLVRARVTRQTIGEPPDRGSPPATFEATLEVNGTPVQRTRVALPANGAAPVRFEPVPLAGGTLRGTVRIPADRLAGDNELHFVVVPGQVLPALILESPAASDTDSLYLRRALEAASRPAVAVQRRSIRDLEPSALRDSSLAILNDVGVPSAAAAGLLRDWVAGGGGLWIVLGELSSDDGWPEAGRELLPAGFGDPVDRSVELGATLAYLDTDHPALRPFSEPGSGDFGVARFYRYRPLQPAPSQGVLARFDDGVVALAEKRVGEGRVLVWTSTMDTFWNDLPLQPVYVPLVHGIARHAAGWVEPSPWLDGGRPLPVRRVARAAGVPPGLVEAGGEATVEVVAADGTTRSLRPAADDTVRLAPGFATVAWDGGASVVAVNLDRRESDLSRIDPEELAASIAWQAGRGTESVEVATDGSRLAESRQSVWWYLLAIAFMLLAVETALSNRLSRHAS